MDLLKFKEWVEAAAATIGVLRTAKDLLPDSPEREAATQLLDQTERNFKAVEAELAKSLGFPICLRCWPPEIMLVSDDDSVRCRRCNKPPPAEDVSAYFSAS